MSTSEFVIRASQAVTNVIRSFEVVENGDGVEANYRSSLPDQGLVTFYADSVAAAYMTLFEHVREEKQFHVEQLEMIDPKAAALLANRQSRLTVGATSPKGGEPFEIEAVI